MTLEQIRDKVKGHRKGFTYSTSHMTDTERCQLIKLLRQAGMSVRVEDILYRATLVTVC